MVLVRALLRTCRNDPTQPSSAASHSAQGGAHTSMAAAAVPKRGCFCLTPTPTPTPAALPRQHLAGARSLPDAAATATVSTPSTPAAAAHGTRIPHVPGPPARPQSHRLVTERANTGWPAVAPPPPQKLHGRTGQGAAAQIHWVGCPLQALRTF